MKIFIKKSICVIAVAFVFLCVFSMRNPIKSVMANDIATYSAEFLYSSHSGTISENSVLSNSTNGEISIKNLKCSLVSDEMSPFYGTHILKSTSSSVLINTIEINISNAVENATITVYALGYSATSSAVFDIVDNNSVSKSARGEVAVYGYYPQDGVFDAISNSATQLDSGTYFVQTRKSVYITRIVVSGEVKSQNEIVTFYDVASEGLLPSVNEQIQSENEDYKFLGWVDSENNLVDHSKSVGIGRYYTVYASIKNLGASILLNRMTAINFTFEIKFLNDRYIRSLFVENNQANIVGKITPSSNNKTHSPSLRKFVIKNNTVTVNMAIYNIPSEFYGTSISSNVQISFGSNQESLCGECIERSIAYVANAALNDLSDEETDNYFNQIRINNGGIIVIKYSKYTNDNRETLKILASGLEA